MITDRTCEKCVISAITTNSAKPVKRSCRWIILTKSQRLTYRTVSDVFNIVSSIAGNMLSYWVEGSWVCCWGFCCKLWSGFVAGETVAFNRLAMSVSARLFPDELLQFASACSAAIKAFTSALLAVKNSVNTILLSNSLIQCHFLPLQVYSVSGYF